MQKRLAYNQIMVKSDILKYKVQKKIIGQIRRAVDDFQMIDPLDKIAVGVSGGKDSLTLLYGLCTLRKYYPSKFNLIAITLDLGLERTDFGYIKQFCDGLDVEYVVKKTDIGNIVLQNTGNSNCSLCANLRRGALNNAAVEMGANKVALGHNRDDLVETLLLSMFYEGRIHTFSPVTHMSKRDIYVIRPLIYASSSDVSNFISCLNIMTGNIPCPVKEDTKRIYVRNLLELFGKDIPFLRENLFGSIKRSSLWDWPNKNLKDEYK